MNERDHLHVPPNFKLVAKIGLSVAATALLGLLLALFVLSDDKASGYGEIIGAFSLAKKNLAPVMIVFGLAMVCFAGVSTWLFALYASFRIAGPMFRISRNLEQQISQGPIAPMPIRATDSLQHEWKAFEASVFALRAHYEELRLALGAVEASNAGNTDALDLAMTQLTKVEHRVRL
jgi:hypothetical protein